MSRANLRFEYTSEQSDALTKFGTGLLNYWNGLDRASTVYSFKRITNFGRTGTSCTRVELRNTDADVAGSKRAEARRASNDEPTLAARWYGMSYYPENWIKDTSPEAVTQWQSKKGISPPLAIWSNNGYWELVVFGTIHRKIAPIETDKWTDIVVHVKWATGSTGLVEVWKDGVKMVTYSGQNSYIGYPGNYMKCGIYKWPWAHLDKYKSITTKRVIYFDEIRIGNELATYNDVKPG